MTAETKQAARRVREIWAAADAAWDELEAAATAALATPPAGFEETEPSTWEQSDAHSLCRDWSIEFGGSTVWVEDRIDTNGNVTRKPAALSVAEATEIWTAEEFDAYWQPVIAAVAKFTELRGL